MPVAIVNQHEVVWTDTGIWVNSPAGHNVARMTMRAREVHLDEFNTCASCKLGKMEPEDWDAFCADLMKFYSIKLQPRMRPKSFATKPAN